MAPPVDVAQDAINDVVQAIAIMGATKKNITGLQHNIETLSNDLRTAQEETSTAQEEARSMREEVMTARQETQRLEILLESEKASNQSLRQRLRDLGDRFAGLQDAFRAGFEVFSTVYQRAQRLVLDTRDIGIDESEAAQTPASAYPAETPVTSSGAPDHPAPAPPTPTSSSRSETQTPSSSTESTPGTPDTCPVGSTSPTNAQATRSAPSPPTRATVECYAMIAHGDEGVSVSLAPQSTSNSSFVRKPARKFGSKTWRMSDISDSLKRNLDSWGHEHLSCVSQILLECAHSGTSGVIYEATDIEQTHGIAIATTNLAIQISESHEYTELLVEQDKQGFVCPSVVVVASSGELVNRWSRNFGALVNGERDKGSNIDSIKVVYSMGGYGRVLTKLRTNRPTILVCTPGRLAFFIRQRRFSARLLHLLVVCQGPSLASADFANDMKKIITWARCVQPVLSRSFERDSALHQELQQRYLNDFVYATNVARVRVGKQPLLAFQGKIKVEARSFNVPARSKHFIEQILPLHEKDKILCMEFSRDRAVTLASQCHELGVSCELFTTEGDNSKAIQQFRSGESRIMFTTPAGFEGIRYQNTKAAVIFASPCQSLYTDANDHPRPGVYNRRTDLLRAAIESIGQAGKDAKVYIFVGRGTAQPVKDDIAKVLRQAGYEVPSVLEPED
ncbi:hypothetical protein QM012_008477 [Aureobasidium pullulans]|uniref:Helicase C-terminal domain-containing protein n=1 Tax=Aureobasidium pullulans TaxID=5580 RepID=A0ABR0TL17_AURPU